MEADALACLFGHSEVDVFILGVKCTFNSHSHRVNQNTEQMIF